MAGNGYHGVHEKVVERFGVWGDALYTFFACTLALAVSGLAAYLTKQPLLFPSLGPAALLFFERPMYQGSSPRNTLIGHLAAALIGALCLVVFGLLDDQSILVEGITPLRFVAAALSLALTGAVLLVSLGLLKTPGQMAMIVVGVVLLIVAAWTINRALRVPVPVWSSGG